MPTSHLNIIFIYLSAFFILFLVPSNEEQQEQKIQKRRLVHLLAPSFPQDHNRFTEPYEVNFARAIVCVSMVHGTVLTQKNSSSITRETYQGGIDLPLHTCLPSCFSKVRSWAFKNTKNITCRLCILISSFIIREA